MPKDLTALIRWVDDWEDATDGAQTDAEVARNYFDGKQWTDDEKTQLDKRGQPLITINLVAKRVNSIVGSEISLRTDPGALPRTPGHEDDASIAEDALRFVADREDLDSVFTAISEQMVVEGYGGVVVEIEEEPQERVVDSEEKASEGNGSLSVASRETVVVSPDFNVKIRPVFWDRLFYDPHSRKKDFSDARYVGVVIWMDAEDAIDEYGEDLRETIETGFTRANSVDDTLEDRPRRWVDERRSRVRVIEMYYKKGGDWWVTHFVHSGFLVEPKPTGFLDERGVRHVCPLIMAGPFVDRENNRYGFVKHMISPQDEINKRRSKALDLITRRQVIAEKGAVDNPHSAQIQLAKPDCYIEVHPGLRFDVVQNQDLSVSHFQLLQEAKENLQEIGPSIPQFSQGGALTAREVLAKIEATQKEMKPFFDVIRQFKRKVYRHIWMRIRQFWTQEKWVRVRDDAGKNGWRFVALNQRMSRAERLRGLLEGGVPLPSALGISQVTPEASMMLQQQAQSMQSRSQQMGVPVSQELVHRALLSAADAMPEMQEMITRNDVAQLDVDIILTEAPDTVIVEQEEFEQLVRLAESKTVAIPPEVILEAYQGRSKQKLLEAVRQPPDDSAQRVQEALVSSQIRQGEAFAAQAVADAQRKQAQVQETMAKTAKIAAETERGVPAEAAKDEALAAKHAAEAGAATVGA